MLRNAINISKEEAIKEFDHCSILFENMDAAFALHEIIISPDGSPIDYRFLYVNQQFEKQTGLKADNILGKTVLDVLPGTEISWINIYGEVALSGKSVNFESFSGVLNKHYKVTAFSPAIGKFATLFMDISDRVEMENLLRLAEGNFRSVYNAVSEAVLIHDLNTYELLDVNEATLQLYGYPTKEEILTKSIEDLSAGTDKYTKKEAEAILEKVKLNQIQPIEWLAKRKDGSTFWIELVLKRSHINSIERLLVVGRDISQKKEDEKKLYESEKKYTSFFAKHKLPILIIDPENTLIVDVNPAACSYYGYTKAELCQKKVSDLNTSSVEDIQEKINKAKTEKQNTFEVKHRLADGSVKDIEEYSCPIIIGNKLYLYSIIQDISEKIQALSEVEKVNKHFQAIIEKATDGITLIDANGQFKYVSPNAEKMFGYTASETHLHHPNYLTHPEDLPEVLNQLMRVLNDKTYQPTVCYRFRHKDGRWIWIESTFTNLLDDNNIAAIVINFKDITERIETEKKLKESREILKSLFIESSKLINSSTPDADYQRFADVYKKVSGAYFAIFNEYDDNGSSFLTRSSAGVDNVDKISNDYLGFNFIGFHWKHDPEKEEKLKQQTITKFEFLSDITKNVVPETVIKNIEKKFNIGCVYVINIVNEGKKFAEIILIFERNKLIENISILEIFSNQVGEYLNRKKTEASLRLSEEKYRLMFENNSQPMCIVDVVDFSFIEVNQAAMSLFGYSKKEFTNMTINDVKVAEEKYLITELANQSLTTYRLDKPVMNKKKNGEKFYSEIYSYKFRYNGKDARHLMFNDITERIRAEELSQRKIDELMRFHKLTVDRELSMIALKKEVNELLKSAGQPEKYKIIGR